MSAQPRPFRAGAQSTFPLPGPLSVGDLLDRAFRLYRARFGLFLLTAAIFLIPVAVISGLFMGSFISSYMQAAELLFNEAINPGFDPFSYFSDNFGGYFGGMLLLGLLSIAANSIVTLALTAQCIETLHGRSMTLAEGIRRGLRRFWPYMGMMIVQGAAIFAATVAVLLPIFGGLLAVVLGGALVGFNLGEANEAAGIISILGMGALFLCGYVLMLILSMIPIIYLSARWLVAPAALIAEGSGPLDSLRRSWRLSRGNVLRAVGYVVLLYLIMALVLALPAGLLQQIFLVLLPWNELELVMGFSTVVSSLFSIIGIPFYIGATVLLYYDLRIRGESYDLEMRIAGLEEQAAQDADPDGAAPDSDVERVD